MRYILFLELVDFYVKCLFSAGKTLDLPVVIHQDKRVLDFSRDLAKFEVKFGMSLREARLILQSRAEFVSVQDVSQEGPCESWRSMVLSYVDSFYSPKPHCAYVDLSCHPRPHELAGSLTCGLRERLGYEVRAGASTCQWLARWNAQEKGEKNLDPGFLDPHEAAYQVRIHEWECLTDKQKRLLQLLGTKRIIDLLSINEHDLRDVFGANTGFIVHLARGHDALPFRANYPKDGVVKVFESSEGFRDRLVLERLISQHCSKISQELSNMMCLATRVEISFSSSENLCDRVERPLAVPTMSKSVLETQVKNIIFRNQALGSASQIRLKVLYERKKSGVQRGLYEPIVIGKADPEGVRNLLTDKYGHNVMVKGSCVPRSVRERWVSSWVERHA